MTKQRVSAHSKRRISAAEMLSDIRIGMKDADLMEKYRVTATGLQSAFEKLVQAGVITWEEINDRTSPHEDTVIVKERRSETRYRPVVPIDVYDADDSQVRGRVVDISERGMKISGVHVQVNMIRTFRIQPEEVQEMNPFIFEAECRWSDVQADGRPLAGFRITHISLSSLDELRKLIRILTVQSE